MTNYLTHLSKLKFNREACIQEIYDLGLKPYNLREKESWDDIYGAVWKDEEIHLRHRKQTGVISKGEEIIRLKYILSNALKEVVTPVATLHRRNTPLPMHKDKMECSINIVLDGDEAPITFEDVGDIYYNAAIVNVSQMHCVKLNPEPRLLLKFCIRKTKYMECVEKLNAFI